MADEITTTKLKFIQSNINSFYYYEVRFIQGDEIYRLVNILTDDRVKIKAEIDAMFKDVTEYIVKNGRDYAEMEIEKSRNIWQKLKDIGFKEVE